MAKLKIDDHPTAKLARQRQVTRNGQRHEAEWLRQVARDCGADDVGLVEFDRPALENEREEIRSRYPWTKTLLSFVLKMSREPVRSPARSVANIEMHGRVEEINHVSMKIVAKLEGRGGRAVNPGRAACRWRWLAFRHAAGSSATNSWRSKRGSDTSASTAT